ncbi:2-oxo-4-hydroxy-4-carboxy-5-ureidoimidazoline decarboxylase [Streptomyces sp. NPDC005438]|uniref:2-oxo-4-hydroxy-4-carboxy-5-ureidoimidazoline decarboxylase n=1 Tax=Streptomyces sp. NPDC005438 TaxID=3156880 RepID=UPI0033B35043
MTLQSPHPPPPEEGCAPLTGAVDLSRFNLAPAREAEEWLMGCLGSERWARLVAGHRPYPSTEVLWAAGREASEDLGPAELKRALARESADRLLPGSAGAAHLVGGPGAWTLDAPGGPSTLAAHTALRAAHAAYERRFGHGFVICLDGFGPSERLDQVLAGIRERLALDAESEWLVTEEELRRIALGRLRALVTEG